MTASSKTPRRMSTSLQCRIGGDRGRRARRRAGFWPSSSASCGSPRRWPSRYFLQGAERHPRRQTARSCVIYDVRHVTTYSYDAPVAFARCALRLLPRDEKHQRVLSSRLDIKPLPVSRNERQDFFGNRVVDVSLETAHRQLRVEARSRVEVRRDEPSLLRTSPAWEEVSRRAFASHTLAPSSPSHFLYPSRLVPLIEPITALRARELSGRQRDHRRRGRSHAPHPSGFPLRPQGDGDLDAYPRGFREADRRLPGLRPCHDRGLARARPAGRLCQRLHPQRSGRPARSASRAPMRAMPGSRSGAAPRNGWIGFDPTNDREVANEHVVLAIGRDYDDISPIHGILLGPGEQEIDVGVDVVPWTGAAA